VDDDRRPEAQGAARTHFYFQDPTAPAPNHPRTLGVIAIIERDGTVLLERRTDAPLWSLVAGMVNDTESLSDALQREVHEETGLRVSRYTLFGTFSDPSRIVSYPDGNAYRVASIVYLVEVETFAGLCASSESEELRFFPKSQLPDLEMPATQRPIVDSLLSDQPPPYLD
jgi:8-oxo-dGTP pyrophosphatase MutT (NUDIX family)